ncbi:MAG: cbb3-type cytochrome c oxidase subunit I [Euryarchaeota archaeon]|nr:cbb3-type cytochrome c oxidase subunit I [Euryarchaeota archaeon]
MRFFATSIVYFLITVTFGILIALGKIGFFDNPIAAHSHIALIGWITITIMGAEYQIVPTLLGKELYNRRLAEIQFWLINIGTIGMFLGFLSGNGLLIFIFGVVVAIAAYLFAFIIFKMLEKKKMILTMKFFVVAILYVLVTVTLGLLIATNAKYLIYYAFPEVKILATQTHLALVGWVSMTIMGAMYQMLPMLSLKKLYSEKLGEAQFWVANVGIIGMTLGFLTGEIRLVAIFGTITAIASYLFAYNMFQTLRTKSETKMKVDISVKFFVNAVIYFLIVVTFGVLIATDATNSIFKLIPGAKIIASHAHLGLIGWVSITIVGGMYHLVPMLVWMERYGPKLGIEKVPTIKELFSEKLANVQLLLFNVGLVGMFLGFMMAEMRLAAISGAIIAIASYIFAYDMLKTIKG